MLFNPPCFSVEMESDQPKFLNKQAGNAAFYYFVLDENGERWLAKGVMYDPNGQILPSLKVVQSDIAKERIANQLYAQFGIPVARLATAMLPAYFKEGNFWKEIAQELELKELPAVLSRFLDHFNDYGDLTHKNIPDLKSNQPHFTLSLDDQPFPEVGLGRVLAVAHWIGDVDVIGGSGGNVGYRLRQHLDFGLIIETCKIDPGGAFKDFETNDHALNRIPDRVQLAPDSDHPLCLTQWQDWSQQTQAEYWETVKAIIDLPEQKLLEIFATTDPDQHYQDTEVCLQRLKARQVHLRTLYQNYVESVENKPQKVIELPDLTQMQSDNPMVRLETHQQVMLTSNSVQQAFHFYIEPFVLIDANLSLDARRNWEEELIHFTQNPQKKVLLLLGPAGAGKSIESLRSIRFAQTAGFTPLRIELKRFTAKTVGHCVINTLKDDYQLSDTQIELLKIKPMLIILDGYDEIASRPRINLYDNNQLAQWANSKVLITCRSQYFTRDMRQDFIPTHHPEGLQEWHLAPLDDEQIQAYFARYHNEYPEFDYDACLAYLKTHDETKELLSTPLMLKLLVEAWPYLNRENKKLTRYDLYEAFFESWEKLQEVRTIQQLGHYERLTEIFREFSEDLAWELYAHEQASVNYTGEQNDPIWDRFFTDKEAEVVKARLGCPLTRKGTVYSFLHKSFADHLVARQLWRVLTNISLLKCIAIWGTRLLVEEEAILQILADYLRTYTKNSLEEQRLWEIIYASRKLQEETLSIAASGAISLLNRKYYSFSKKDLSGIRIPGADLAYSVCTETKFEGACLDRVKFKGACLHGTIFQNASMIETKFGEYPIIQCEGEVQSIACSLDGCYIAIAEEDSIVLYDAHNLVLVRRFKQPSDQVMHRHLSFSTDGRRVLLGNSVMDIVFSPDGQYILSANTDETVRLLNIKTGNSQIWKGHRDQVTCVAFSPNGQHVLSGSLDKTIRFWNIETGTSKILAEHKWSVNSVAFSPDGLHALSGSDDRTIQLCNIKTGESKISLKHLEKVNSVSFSPDGFYVLSGSNDGTIRLWNVETGASKILAKHKWSVNSVAFSPDGLHALSGSDDKTIRLWNIKTGESKILKGHQIDCVTGVRFLPDGLRVLFCSSDYTVQLLELLEIEIVSYQTSRHTKSICDVAFSPNGQQVLSGSYDDTIRLWNMETGDSHIWKGKYENPNKYNKHLFLLHETLHHYRHYLTFSWDGQHILSCGDKTVYLLNIEKGDFHTWKENGVDNILNFAFLHDSLGVVILTSNHSGESLALAVHVWSVEAGSFKMLIKFTNHRLRTTAFSPDGQQLLLAYELGILCIWNIQTDGSKTLNLTDMGEITIIAPSPDNQHVLCGSIKGVIQVLNIETEKYLILKGHVDEITSLAFSPDGRQVLSGGEDHTVRVWDAETGQCLQLLTTGESVNAVAWHPSGNSFVVGTDSTGMCVYQRDAVDMFFLDKLLPRSDVLDLTNCRIEGSLLSDQDQLFLKQRGTTGFFQLEGVPDISSGDSDHHGLKRSQATTEPISQKNTLSTVNQEPPMVTLQPNPEPQTFQQRLKTIAETFGISVELTRSYSPGFLKPLAQTYELACVLGSLLCREVKIDRKQEQVTCTAGEGDTLCLELTLNEKERLLFLNYYQNYEDLVVSGERSGHLRMKLVLNMAVFEETLLPILAELYRENQENPNPNKKCLVM